MKTRGAKLTPQFIDEFCTYIENGMTAKDSCNLCSINEATFYRWLHEAEAVDEFGRPIPKYVRQRELKDAVEKAKASFKAYHVQAIIKASKRNWTASAWLLERRYPEEYGAIDRRSAMDRSKVEEKDEQGDNLLEALRVSCNDVMSREGDEPEDV